MTDMNRIKEKWSLIPLGIKVSTAYAICSILQRCLSFITLPLFTRILTTTQYGQVTIYGSWQGFLQLFLTLNLAYGSFTTAMVKFEEDRKGYISSIQGICVALSLLFLMIYLPFRSLWNCLFELPTYLIYVMVMEILCMTATQLWTGEKRFEFKYVSVVTITLLTSIISPIIQYLFVVNADEKGYARILGAAVTTCAVGGFFFVFNALRGKKLFNREYWKYALGFNIPLLAYYLSQIVFNQSDRIMISHMVGTDKAAIYGVAYSLAMIMTFVLNSINGAYVPWLYNQYKLKKYTENRTIGNYIAILLAIMILPIVWFAPEVLSIMAGDQYYEARWIVPPVSMSLFTYLYVVYSTNFEFFYEEKKALVRASIGSAIINVVLNAIFIPKVGYLAAGYTTLASYILFAIYNYCEMKKIANKNAADDGYDWRSLIILYIIFMILCVVGMLLYTCFIIRVSMWIVAVCIGLFNRKSIIACFKKIKEGYDEC